MGTAAFPQADLSAFIFYNKCVQPSTLTRRRRAASVKIAPACRRCHNRGAVSDKALLSFPRVIVGGGGELIILKPAPYKSPRIILHELD